MSYEFGLGVVSVQKVTESSGLFLSDYDYFISNGDCSYFSSSTNAIDSNYLNGSRISVAPGEALILWSSKDFGGKCQYADKTKEYVGEGMRNGVKSVQKVTNNSGIILYERSHFSATHDCEYHSGTSNEAGSFSDKAESAKVFPGEAWKLYAQPNLEGDCMYVDKSVTNMGQRFRTRIRSLEKVDPGNTTGCVLCEASDSQGYRYVR